MQVGFKSAVLAAVVGSAMLMSGTAQAGVFSAAAQSDASAGVPHVVKTAGGYYGRYRYRGAQVRGYRRRAGGYSYVPSDTINTYGDSRSLFGSTNSYRDPAVDRQTLGGPFDHGWFFDSGIGRNGGNSPYMN
jgi:hypothetical protein